MSQFYSSESILPTCTKKVYNHIIANLFLTLNQSMLKKNLHDKNTITNSG